MEGISGVSNWRDVNEESPAYLRFLKLLTHDLKAAIDGAVEAGVQDIVINDAHGYKRNVLFEDFPENVTVISGPVKGMSMMHGVDSSFKAVFLIGYHAKAGTAEAVCNHTLSGTMIHTLKINGIEVGETEVSSLVAGEYNLPVVLVSGDDKVAEQAAEFLGNVKTAVVKKSIGMTEAECYTPNKTYEVIKTNAFDAISQLSSFKPKTIDSPYVWEIEFHYTPFAKAVENMPFVTRVDGRKIKFTTDTVVEGYKQLISLGWTAMAAIPLIME